MRSRPETRILPIAAALIAIAAMTAAPRAERQPQTRPRARPRHVRRAQPPTDVEIAQAIEAVKKDPNLDTEMTVKTLRWTGTREARREEAGRGRFSPGCAISCAGSNDRRGSSCGSRVAILAGWLVIYIVRLVRAARRRAAWHAMSSWRRRTCAIWISGRKRCRRTSARRRARCGIAASSARRWCCCIADCCRVWRTSHRVPIRDSSTEGDCLALAADHLAEPSRRDYASRLIQVWRRAVYGRQEPDVRGGLRSVRRLRAGARHRSSAPRPRFDRRRRLAVRRRAHDVAPRLIVLSVDRASSCSTGPARGSRITPSGSRHTMPMPLKGEAATESVLRRAAIRRTARRDDELGSHLRRAAGGCGDRALDVAMEPEREPPSRARTLGRERRPPRRRQRPLGRRRGVRALVGHRLEARFRRVKTRKAKRTKKPHRKKPHRKKAQRKKPYGSGRDGRSHIGRRRRRGMAPRSWKASRTASRTTSTTARRRRGCRRAKRSARNETACRLGSAPMPRRSLCWLADDEVLRAKETVLWALHGEKGMQAVRVRVGRGSVTVINAVPFRIRGLFHGDHAWLLVNATQMKRGDEIHFLSEDEYPGLLALAWMRGWPVVCSAAWWSRCCCGAARCASVRWWRRRCWRGDRWRSRFAARASSCCAAAGGGAARGDGACARRNGAQAHQGIWRSDRRGARVRARQRDRRSRARRRRSRRRCTTPTRAGVRPFARTLARIEAARRHVIGEDTDVLRPIVRADERKR